ncbi:MAG TPA: hypothetical protein VGP06_17890, partial [Janthinobacterium sp.]|nr:hypothetical protein [Janthinobacterium sp.]
LKLASGGVDGRMYVYAGDDWPMWRRALRHDAMALYAARQGGTAKDEEGDPARLPAWPCGALFALCMLLLWWRERR